VFSQEMRIAHRESRWQAEDNRDPLAEPGGMVRRRVDIHLTDVLLTFGG